MNTQLVQSVNSFDVSKLNSHNSVILCSNSTDKETIIGTGETISEFIIPFNLLNKNWDLELDYFINENKGKYIFGYIAYDLKNFVEGNLESNNNDDIKNHNLHFFVPSVVYKISQENFNIILNNNHDNFKIDLNQRTSKNQYIQNVNTIKEYLQKGSIYEVNYCQEFYKHNVEKLNTFKLFSKLNYLTEAPFSTYLHLNDIEVISGSPERYIQKKNNHIISQPIKGTIKRGIDKNEDNTLKNSLSNDEKEKAENVMIVDLVRNDLSRIATQGSVKVDELFGIYTFKTVHQMISTVSCDISEKTSFSDVLKATYPMGSMTGAPKISAMKIIEELEDFKRGIYAGSVGYISPTGDFDFNVIIRSIIYNNKLNNLSASIGSAITIKSEAELEYKENLLKYEALKNALNS